MGEWCRQLDLNYDRIKSRLSVHNIDPEIALTNKMLTQKNIYSVNGDIYRSLSEAAEAMGMSISGVHARIKSENWPNWYKL